MVVAVDAGFTTSASTSVSHFFSGSVSAQDFTTISEIFTEQVVAVVGEDCKFSVTQLFFLILLSTDETRGANFVLFQYHH